MNSPSPQPPHKSSGQNQLPDGLGACLLLAAIGLLLLALPFVSTEKSVATQTLQGLGWILTALGIVGGLLLWPRISRSLRSMELAMAGSHDGMFEWDPLIGVGNGSRRPLPPNPVCGFPATGSPVSCFRIGIDAPIDGLLTL